MASGLKDIVKLELSLCYVVSNFKEFVTEKIIAKFFPLALPRTLAIYVRP